MNYITQDIYEAAFIKLNGYELGIVRRNQHTGLVDIELKGIPEELQHIVNAFHKGAPISNALLFVKECSYIRYLVKRYSEN